MEHTFLQRPGRWSAQGHFITADGRMVAARGGTEIEHRPGLWLIRGVMRPELEGMPELRNDYAVRPLSPGSLATTWTSENPSLGTINGNFAVAGDAIISVFMVDGGKASGSETLLLLADGSYLNRGAMFSEGLLASAWGFILRLED